jgi:Ran GTPase-activating protein (RanGAP) involved in mRNA processing and transport
LGAISLGECLRGNSTLKELDIGWNQIRIRGLQVFLSGCKDLSNLNFLNIEHNGIGDQGNCLTEYLAKCQITKFNLGYTRMSDVSFPTLIKGLEGNKTLHELNISGNSFSPEALQLLFKCIGTSKITTLIMKVFDLLMRIFDCRKILWI